MRREGKKLGTSVLKEFDAICKNYTIRSSEDNLNSLLDVFQRLKPNWVEQFNDLNQRLLDENKIEDKVFDDFLTAELPKDYTVKDLKVPKNKDEDPFVDIMQRGRIIHVANKIAHHFEDVFHHRLNEYIIKNNISCETREEQYEVRKLVKKVYNPATNERVKELAKSTLMMLYGFEEQDFEKGKNLDVLNLSNLIQAYNDGMYMKALEIENVNKLAHDYDLDDLSYGVKKVDEDNILFVMDVQGFGQFSVHMKDPNLIAQIKNKYRMPIYRRKTEMLVNHMSEDAKEFVQECREDDSMDEERNIPKFASETRKQRARLLEEIKFLDLTKAEKHELAVKGGLMKKELEELDFTEEER